jgi:CheY-like chemotaxis protein
MDINMPIMDGIEATKILKTKYKNKIWICMLTAYNEESEKQRAQIAGSDSFINKPLTLDKIYSEFYKYLFR